MEKNQESVVRSVSKHRLCSCARGLQYCCDIFVVWQGEQDEYYGAQFEYSSHKNEVILAGVFVRIYNEQVAAMPVVVL